MSDPTTTQGESSVVTFLKQRWFALLILVLVIVVIAANTQEAEIDLVVTTLTAPVWLVLSITLVLGILIGWILKTRRAKRRS